ncbi:folylpolyglutamate synthase/dihydrofolate synthase family protein [Marinoscillum sp. MHG1-6]|uniref:bifunctional folylpolyglutamate synthase/dihydrofolate synthase n=1 Tax=Marinoscillum sp. MHG1-6 TaxID=2959627 RepID=UPI0021582B1A|nr:folylpolyglutamate synthase/dihydrofolate synthase family protein [Marinoscillum sp. MHG1-6]
MTYGEALDYLYSRLPMFQRVGAPALKYDLNNTLKILEAIGNPHQQLRCIHVAGTNGKGSSSHALASILQEAGYKVGLFTSPHLKSFTERARVNGIEMEEHFVGSFVEQYRSLVEQIKPSFFELTFAMSMLHFQRQQVDWAIVETGLGGRLDSTNVISPEVCLITMIGWDHTDLLGDSLEKIAAEKAGIIKQNVPVIIGADQPELYHVFDDMAGSVAAPIFNVQDVLVEEKLEKDEKCLDIYIDNQLTISKIFPDISASYFVKNLPGIIKVVEVLRNKGFDISGDAVKIGLETVKRNTGLKGRWQVLAERPLVVADISHNLAGLQELFDQVNQQRSGEFHLIIGMVKDKSIEQILELVAEQKASLYFTHSHTPRALPVEELKQKAIDFGLQGEAFDDVNDAIDHAAEVADKNDLILVCGSTFVVAEIENL